MKGFALIGKVLIGFLLTGAALSIAILFMYRSIHDVSKAVDEAAKPNQRLVEWKTAVNILYLADNKAHSWRFNKKQSDLDEFDSLREESAIHIARLKSLNHDSARGLAFCDSLQVLSADRFDLLGEWIQFSASDNEESTVLNDILQKMADKEKAVTKKNKEIADSVSNENLRNVPVVKERNFWQRHTRKKEPVIVTAPDSVKRKDTLVAVVSTGEIKKAIETGRVRMETKDDSLLREESFLLHSDQRMLNRIHELTDEYEKLCNRETAEKLQDISEASAAGTQSVTQWTITAALCIILFSVFFIGRDIMRNRKLQAQLLVAKENAERLAKSKEDFMANMSHEIRTPLNVISGFSSQLLEQAKDEKQKKHLEGIYRSSEFLMALVNDVLDYSKVKSGKLQLEKIPFSLKDIAADLENAFGLKAKEKGVEFSVSISPALPAHILGDPVRFRQILFNLVSNAVKFTDKGFIRTSFEKNNDGMEIRISDSGIGIAKNKTQTIFEEFEQADVSITRKYGGTGLGLSISKILVREMKGEIRVDSEPGKGTTFIIVLPVEAAQEIKKKNDLNPVDKTLLENKTVLLCDDDPMNRLLASHMITAYGAKVKEACGGKEAIEFLSAEKADIILIDLKMPDMSGEEVIKAIRQPGNLNTSTPVIAISGKSKEQTEVVKDLIDGYLQKPYKEADLLREIKNVLEKKNQKR
jgi:signal transduction histidine kinase/CheY-like chemotaxis protein